MLSLVVRIRVPFAAHNSTAATATADPACRVRAFIAAGDDDAADAPDARRWRLSAESADRAFACDKRL